MIKTIHITTIVISISLFIGRGMWLYALKRDLTARWIKFLPHINDTVLLITGIILAVQLQQYPLSHDWLTVKIICLLIYIGLGFSAMKWHKATSKGMLSWFAAIGVFAYMLTVALNHHPMGIFHSL